jgi:hypothetical protein
MIIRAIDQQATNARRAHFSEGDPLRAVHTESLRAASSATAAAPFSIGILINWRRKHLAIYAPGKARADRAWLNVRRDKLLRPSGIPRFADAGSPVLRLGLCRRDDSDSRQRSCVHGQCEKPFRKFAHALLPLRRNTAKIGLQTPSARWWIISPRGAHIKRRRGLVPRGSLVESCLR